MHWSVGMLLHAVCVLFPRRKKRDLLRTDWAAPSSVLLILDDIPSIHFSNDRLPRHEADAGLRSYVYPLFPLE